MVEERFGMAPDQVNGNLRRDRVKLVSIYERKGSSISHGFL